MDEQIPPHLQASIEGLMENEAMTGDLDDEPAQALLAWGIDNLYLIHTLHPNTSTEQFEEATYGSQRANRKMLRRISRWTARRQENNLSQNIEQLDEVIASAQTLYEKTISLDESQKTHFLEQFSGDAPLDFIQALRSLLENN